MKTNREPPITVLKDDLNKLRPLAGHASPVGDYLANELERARIVDATTDVRAIVHLGTVVKFSDSAKGETHRLRLVMPNEADIDAGRISILTPVGAALLGLAAGQSITYTLPKGGERTLHVLEVIPD